MSSVSAWVGEASYAPISCVIHPIANLTSHGEVKSRCLLSASYMCTSGYSEDELRSGFRKSIVPCSADRSFDRSNMTCNFIICDVADLSRAQVVTYSGGALLTSLVSLGSRRNRGSPT